PLAGRRPRQTGPRPPRGGRAAAPRPGAVARPPRRLSVRDDMDTWLSGPDLREQLLDEVIAAYFDDVALGREPRREELFARWPDLAGDLAAFFADRDRLDRLAAPLRQTSRAGGPRQAPPPPAAAAGGPGA